MRKLLFINLFLILLMSCTTHRVITDDTEKGDIMITAMKGKYSLEQFDSMCASDTIPNNFMEWQFLGLKDYESTKRVCLFYYVKSKGAYEAVYKIEETMDDSVKINKRIIKN